MKKARKPKTDAVLAIGDRLLTLREAAEVLRLNPRTVRDVGEARLREHASHPGLACAKQAQ